ncbi:hypothetical protein BCR43DRAFT_514496 [Syncephalastrum racemosum]|uniref:Enoyl reductase (ER) domain-containing protein n=1 Tax=Syncephalastrum racemosum TaxID=13706 RepID=A0A1X2HGW0_SYNRA|nr:hypothetical protein BCR43DRAFT_514496 [Syncephalastrum racemosum]
MVLNKQVIFVKHVTAGFPVPGEHLQVHATELDLDAPLAQDEYIIKNLVFSIDPYMAVRMRPGHMAGNFVLGKPAVGFGMGVVIKSNNPDIKEGDLVQSMGNGPYEEYTKVRGDLLQAYKVCNDPKTTGLPISNYAGVLSMPGLTAYYGLMTRGQPKQGETLYVSAASGAVGQLVGQMGKVLGLRVIGSAGSDEKVAYLKEIGFDGAFNYKASDISEKLEELCPNGIDIYFDNVGGRTLEAAIAKSNVHARVVLCGMSSQYGKAVQDGIHNLFLAIPKEISLLGFNASYATPELTNEFRRTVTSWLQQGKIKYREDIAEGIDLTPQALLDVFEGRNFGKQIVKVADI